MKNDTTEQTEITARAKAFSGQGTRAHRFLVASNDVKVWDPIAGHYTGCNALSSHAKARIARLAK
jgi:hypothetical protein